MNICQSRSESFTELGIVYTFTSFIMITKGKKKRLPPVGIEPTIPALRVRCLSLIHI